VHKVKSSECPLIKPDFLEEMRQTMTHIKSLAMLKMEKNFRALEKGYPRQPYKQYSVHWLFQRLMEETKELAVALENSDYQNGMCEFTDVSNIVDYIFEKLSQKREAQP
jgi:NTP pyrophosphatase (non-canonical NTP hydrolase)